MNGTRKQGWTVESPVGVFGYGWGPGCCLEQSEIGVYALTLLSAALRCVEGKQAMALVCSSDPRVLLAVPLPGRRCLVMKLEFFHVWSSCTLKCKLFSYASGQGVCP